MPQHSDLLNITIYTKGTKWGKAQTKKKGGGTDKNKIKKRKMEISLS